MDLTGGGNIDSFGPDTQGRITLTMTGRNAVTGHAVYVERFEVPQIVDRLLMLIGEGRTIPDEVASAYAALADALFKLRAFGHEADALDVEQRHGFIYQAPEPFVTRMPT